LFFVSSRVLKALISGVIVVVVVRAACLFFRCGFVLLRLSARGQHRMSAVEIAEASETVARVPHD
jgi:hypothetical protein